MQNYSVKNINGINNYLLKWYIIMVPPIIWTPGGIVLCDFYPLLHLSMENMVLPDSYGLW